MSGVTREVENAYLSETLDSAFLIMHVNVSCYVCVIEICTLNDYSIEKNVLDNGWQFVCTDIYYKGNTIDTNNINKHFQECEC